jgi:N-dimethylarginine dimethylaminohydrolase
MMNQTVVMSGVEWFDDAAAINPFMDSSVSVDRERARAEHEAIRGALEGAGVNVIKVAAPEHCQDGVYTANWALVRGNTAVLASLPNARKGEESYAEQVLKNLAKTVLHIPEGLRFSGQGDALPCGDYLFTGLGYRSDETAQQFAADTLGFTRVALQTVPRTGQDGRAVINTASGWPDSFFYDIDLALSVLRNSAGGQKGLIAWCPEAFLPESQKKLRAFDGVDKIEVSLKEAKEAFACNLVSTGETVVMSNQAPLLRAELENRGFTVVTPEITELAKGGGYIRCTTLTL